MDAAHTPTPPAGPSSRGTSEAMTVRPLPGQSAACPTIPPIPFPELPPRTAVHKLPDLVVAWPRSAQWAMVVLLVLAVGLLCAHVVSSLRWGSRPTNLEHGLGYRIDLNQADEAELLQLPGIGPNRVKLILKYRRAHGGFCTVDELRNIHGIGTATLETLRPWVCVGFEEADEENEPVEKPLWRPRVEGKGRGNAQGAEKPRPRSGKKGAHLKEKIIINHATVEQLRLLPYIGEKLALRIIAERQKRPFVSVEDLKRVGGIKDGILAQVRPYATVSRKPEPVVPQD